MKLAFRAEDSNGPTTTCEITTYDAEPQLEMPFDNDEAVLKIIMKSSWLRDALSELDPSYEKLTFMACPPPDAGKPRKDTASNPLFRILAVGAYGSTEMDYPDDREVLETFQCEEPVKFSYRVSLICRTLKVLQTSSKTSLRINEEGLLGFQFLVPSNKQGCSEAYIDFRCLPLDDDV
jgi:cell cycle checkpoint protein